MKTGVNAINKQRTGSIDPAKALVEAFPSVEPGLKPYGHRVLVQLRRTPDHKQLANGQKLYLTRDTQDTEKWNTQVAKVIALGPIAFRDRKTQVLWPEGAWCEPGVYVRVPKYGGDRWEVPVDGEDDNPALFAVFDDLSIIGERVGDPLSMKAFI